MKKLITIGLAAAVLFTFAGQAKAALETSGEIRARAWLVENYVANGQTTEWFDQRLRLNLVWPVAEGVKVNVRADILEGFWGENSKSTTSFITVDNKIGSTTVGTDAKPPIAFDQVNMVFKWPGTPITFTIGRQDVSWGTGFVTKADNRDRFKVSAAISPALVITYAYDKNLELFTAHESTGSIDDSRAFTLVATGAVAGWNYGVGGIYSLDDTFASGSATERWIGIAYATGKAGPVALQLEGTYWAGDNETAAGAKTDVTGIGAYGSVAMPAGPVKIMLEGAYVAGDDLDTRELENGFKSEYQSPFWSIILFTNLDVPGYQQLDNKQTSNLSTDTGMQNAFGGKLTVSMTPAKGLTFILSGLYAQALEDIMVITTPAKAATATTPAVAAVSTRRAADPLGFEFDLLAMYSITDNVSFLGGVGYLMAGDMFGDVDDPWGVMASLAVKF